MFKMNIKPSPRVAGASQTAFFGGPLRRLSQSVSIQTRKPAFQVQGEQRKNQSRIYFLWTGETWTMATAPRT